MAGGIRGRRPKPTSQKIRQGNPGRRKLKKVIALKPLKRWDHPPAWLNGYAKSEWKRIAPSLIVSEILTEHDRAAFEAYCVAYGRWRQMEALLDKTKDDKFVAVCKSGFEQQVPWVSMSQKYMERMTVLASHFGLTPATRSKAAPAGDGKGKGAGQGDAFFAGSDAWKRAGKPGALAEA